MTKPSTALVLPLCLAIAVACNGDSVGPERVLTTLEVSAPLAPLFPDYTSQLTISAWDQFGVPMLERADGEWARTATYFTNAPEIAKVSAGGIVTGVAPGKAEITAMLMLDGVTQVASVTATVLERPVAAAPERVLTTLEVSAPNAPLFPDYTSQLTISAWDQFGVPMLERADGEWARTATYFTNAPEIAKVSAGGIVTGVAPGKAEITAMLMLDGVTQVASVTATVLERPVAAATVTANERGGWSPATIRLKAGGTVTWVVPEWGRIGTIWFNVWATNREKIEFIDGQASRTFPTPGTFSYGDGFGLMWYESGGVVYVY